MNGERSESDYVLVVAVARRDHAALSELYRRHGGSLLCAALRVLSDRKLSEAEEVVQDVFVRLWRYPERFDPARGSLRSFLLTQCHGRAVDFVRSGSARRLREQNDEGRSTSTTTWKTRSWTSWSTRRCARPLGFSVTRSVRRSAWRTSGATSYVEVASLLGVPEGTAKSRIRSGLARLRPAVVEAGIDPLMTNSSSSASRP